MHGWIELNPGADGDDEPVTLALLSEFLRTGTDGWQLALTSVRDWFAQPSPPGPATEFTTSDAGTPAATSPPRPSGSAPPPPRCTATSPPRSA